MKIHDNVISANDLERLVNFYREQPISNTKRLEDGRIFRHMKHSLYDCKDLLPFKIVNPILSDIFGTHWFDGGHYLDAHWPFCAHFDTKEVLSARDVYGHQPKKNLSTTGVIFPFVENIKFAAVFFDYFLDSDEKAQIQTCSTQPNSPETMDLLDHHSKQDFDSLRYIPVADIAEWKVGRMISWPRNQLHCSSNFAKYGLTKQGLVLWI